MPSRRARRPAARPRAPRPRPPSESLPLLVPEHLALREPPHAHSVCRNCGRIAEVELSGLDAAQLTGLAGGTSEEWAIEGISLSLTGLCPRCRRGLAAPEPGGTFS